jgi:XisI protein
MAQLDCIVREEVAWYAGNGRGANVILFPMLDDLHETYAVNAIEYPTRSKGAGVVVLARIVGDIVVIQKDNTDKPLYQALLQRVIPRHRIVLAYAGEPIPDAERFAL